MRTVLRRMCAISPLDGRYAKACAPLARFFSESGLVQYRYKVEINWVLHLGRAKVCQSTPELEKALVGLRDSFSHQDYGRVKAIEQVINHDVKAVEMLIRQKLAAQGLHSATESVHLCLTSEDVNNLSYGMMLTEALHQVILPEYRSVQQWLQDNAVGEADSAMLARTHGQPASPTTMGKELANFAYRLREQVTHLERVKLKGKCNGAVGNFNAHTFAYPQFDWPAITKAFIQSIGLESNPYTTQIESHDSLARLSNEASLANTILLSLCRDMWQYISMGYFKLRANPNEVGSSTMPHKVNPIDFENAEGNLGVANSLLAHFASKLPVSRLQRDLSDSTVLRTQGTAFGHAYLALGSLKKGLSKIQANRPLMAQQLDSHLQVITEAIQTLLRRKQYPDAYDLLKKVSRGSEFNQHTLQKLIAQLGSTLTPEEASRVLQLRPGTYTGRAADLARMIKK